MNKKHKFFLCKYTANGTKFIVETDHVGSERCVWSDFSKTMKGTCEDCTRCDYHEWQPAGEWIVNKLGIMELQKEITEEEVFLYLL